MFMKGKLALTAVLTAISALPSMSRNLTDISQVINALRADSCFNARARLEVSLPQSADDVIYTLQLKERNTGGSDKLASSDYLITWKYENAPGGTSEGFTAYFSGNHYRFNADRLQEYHMTWDSIPFTSGNSPVQKSAQFVWLLPTSIAEKLELSSHTPGYTSTVSVRNDSTLTVVSRLIIDGLESHSDTYRFSYPAMRLLSIASENNPGAISEQSMKVTYSYPPDSTGCPPMTEENLAAAFPDAFGRFRVSNFKIENMRGTPLPAFALPTSTGERYSRNRGDAFRTPTVIVILDPHEQFASATVKAVRRAVDRLDYPADIIWASVSTSPDAAEQAVGALNPGEHLLISATPLARDCGAVATPSILMTDNDAIVRDVEIGFNNNLESIVIQKMSLLNK